MGFPTRITSAALVMALLPLPSIASNPAGFRRENGSLTVAARKRIEACSSEKDLIVAFATSAAFNRHSHSIRILRKGEGFELLGIVRTNNSMITGKRVPPSYDTVIIDSVNRSELEQIFQIFRDYKVDSTSFRQLDGPSYSFAFCNDGQYGDGKSSYEIQLGVSQQDTPNELAFCRKMKPLLMGSTANWKRMKGMRFCYEEPDHGNPGGVRRKEIEPPDAMQDLVPPVP